jgi:hypothetical protein
MRVSPTLVYQTEHLRDSFLGRWSHQDRGQAWNPEASSPRGRRSAYALPHRSNFPENEHIEAGNTLHQYHRRSPSAPARSRASIMRAKRLSRPLAMRSNFRTLLFIFLLSDGEQDAISFASALALRSVTPAYLSVSVLFGIDLNRAD